MVPKDVSLIYREAPRPLSAGFLCLDGPCEWSRLEVHRLAPGGHSYLSLTGEAPPYVSLGGVSLMLIAIYFPFTTCAGIPPRWRVGILQVRVGVTWGHWLEV